MPAEVSVLVPALHCVRDCICVGVHVGLSVEERPAEEELEGTLVHLKAKQLVLLHRGGPQGVPGQHSSGWELLCGGKQLTLERTVAFYNNVFLVTLPRNEIHCSFVFLCTYESFFMPAVPNLGVGTSPRCLKMNLKGVFFHDFTRLWVFL